MTCITYDHVGGYICMPVVNELPMQLRWQKLALYSAELIMLWCVLQLVVTNCVTKFFLFYLPTANG